MTRRMNRLSIDINWDADDSGYSALTSSRVIKFVMINLSKGNNLIQTYKSFLTHGKTTLCIQAKRYTTWPQQLEWEDLKCATQNKWILASPCNVGNRNKLFIKYKSNSFIAGFSLYLMALYMGEITLEKHKEFVRILQKTMKEAYIHNEDVDRLHIKSTIINKVIL